MLKVVHVLNELLPSGAEVMLEVAAPHWAKHNINCSILATGSSSGIFTSRLETAGYAIEHLPLSNGVSSVMKLRRWLKGRSIECLHIHTEKQQLYKILSSKGWVPRVVCTHHNAFQFNGFLRYRRIITRRIGKWAGARYIAASDSIRENEASRFHNHAQTIRNWYDGNKYNLEVGNHRLLARKELGLEASDLVILSVGNCGAAKNHEALIRAIQINHRLPIVYLHAGNETNDAERYLAEQLGVADRIRFLGPRSDVPKLLAACDGFVMPSLYEGLGISALEALASGIPCLLADAPGLKDFKPYGPFIHWVSPSVDGLANGLAEWTPKLNASLRSHCHDQATNIINDFGVDAGVASYSAAYKGQLPPTT